MDKSLFSSFVWSSRCPETEAGISTKPMPPDKAMSHPDKLQLPKLFIGMSKSSRFQCTKFECKIFSLLFHNYREMSIMCQEGNSTLIPPGKSPGNMEITKMHSVFKKHAQTGYRV